MDDTNTNLNSSANGSPNWAAAQGIPVPQGTDKPAPAGQTGQTGTVKGNEQAGNSVEVANVDVLTAAEKASTKLSVNSNETTNNYTTPINQPVLVPSTVNDPALAQKTLQMINNPSPQVMQASFANLASILPGATATTPPDDSTKAADALVTDPQVLALAQKTGVAPSVLQKNVQADANQNFEALVSKLPADVANKLTFAHYVPDGAKNLSPELQQQLATINAQVQQGVAKDFNFTGNLTNVATDATDFLNQLSISVDTSFEKLLQAKIDDGSITAADAATLRAMHNGMATGSPTLKNLLKQLEGQVTAQLQAKFGFDVSYQPKGDVASYNNIVNGDFAQTYQKNIAKYTGTATAEQKALLEKYAANPKDPTIPDSIKQLAAQIANDQQKMLDAFPDFDNSSLPDNLKTAAKQIFGASKTEIITKYGLETTWAPTITALYAPGVDPATIKAGNTAISTAQEIVAGATNAANALPPGPEKTQFLAFLKVIGEALSSLQEAIYSMQASQSQTSKEMNRAKLETQLNDIDKQQRAADEAKDKQSKMAGMGPIGKIFDWIFKIAILCLGACFGPIAFAFALAYFVDSAVSQGMGNKETFTQKLFQEIAKTMPPAAAAVVNLVLAVVISCVSCNVLLAINLITQDSFFMQNLVKACGGDAMAQNIAAMVFNMIAQIALMVAMMIVTGGAATAAVAAEVSAMVARATGLALETAAKVVRIAMIVTTVIIASLQVSAQAIQINNNVLLSQIDMIKGHAEAYSEELQGIIAAMKKVIEKLLALLQGNSDALTSISNFQGQKWAEASAISSDIAG